MHPTDHDRPDAPDDRLRDDPSVRQRGRSLVRSVVVIWAAVILLGIAFLALILAFAFS